MMFVPHWKHSPPLSATGDSFTVLYVDDVRTSQETHPRASTTCYGDSFTLLNGGDNEEVYHLGQSVMQLKVVDISYKHIAPIFRVEMQARQKTESSRNATAANTAQ
jgi:hypothetical protein